MSESTTGFSADWYHALATALPEDAAPTLDKVDVADSKAGRLAEAQARVEQEKHDRAVALRLLRAFIDRSQEGKYVGLTKAWNEKLGDARNGHTPNWVRRQFKFACDPRSESLHRPDARGHAARSKASRTSGLDRKQPTPHIDWCEIRDRCPASVPLDEPDELPEHLRIPADGLRTPAGDFQGRQVLGDDVGERKLIEF